MNDYSCTRCKVSNAMEKYTVFVKSCCNLTKFLFVLFDATTKSMSCFLFLKNVKKYFCNLTYKKNSVKLIENLPHHLLEKFINDNLSITNIALRN